MIGSSLLTLSVSSLSAVIPSDNLEENKSFVTCLQSQLSFPIVEELGAHLMFMKGTPGELNEFYKRIDSTELGADERRQMALINLEFIDNASPLTDESPFVSSVSNADLAEVLTRRVDVPDARILDRGYIPIALLHSLKINRKDTFNRFDIIFGIGRPFALVKSAKNQYRANSDFITRALATEGTRLTTFLNTFSNLTTLLNEKASIERFDFMGIMSNIAVDSLLVSPEDLNHTDWINYLQTIERFELPEDVEKNGIYRVLPRVLRVGPEAYSQWSKAFPEVKRTLIERKLVDNVNDSIVCATLAMQPSEIVPTFEVVNQHINSILPEGASEWGRNGIRRMALESLSINDLNEWISIFRNNNIKSLLTPDWMDVTQKEYAIQAALKVPTSELVSRAQRLHNELEAIEEGRETDAFQSKMYKIFDRYFPNPYS